jgi:hypothetical protein
LVQAFEKVLMDIVDQRVAALDVADDLAVPVVNPWQT